MQKAVLKLIFQDRATKPEKRWYPEKRDFYDLDRSQAHHCLQMADKQTVQLLAFNFGSRTFACLRLAQS